MFGCCLVVCVWYLLGLSVLTESGVFLILCVVMIALWFSLGEVFGTFGGWLVLGLGFYRFELIDLGV